jgi:ATP-dependent Clp protease protease subunit
MITERENNIERTMDPYSRLLKDRVIFLQGKIEDNMADAIVAQLLLLEAQDPQSDITIYINSPGGSVTAGLAIKNTMDFITCDVRTIGLGLQASMGAFLLASGTPGKRGVLKDSQIMIHQVLSGCQGQATDMEITMKHTLLLKEKLNRYLSEYTQGRVDYDTMVQMCERDNWLQPQEALELGLIDNIYTSRKEM